MVSGGNRGGLGSSSWCVSYLVSHLEILIEQKKQEGLFSMLMGILGFFIVPSTPGGSKFLTEEEKE